MASLFISYSRKDIEFARKLTEAFTEKDLDFWIDWEDIPPTVEWWQEIEKGIEEADIFLFLLSPDSAKSKVCKQEIEHAAKNGKRLLPIVVRDIKANESPSELSQLNWIFFREIDDFEGSYEKLITAIKTDYGWVQIHRRLQVRALEWERGNKDNSFLLRGKDLQDAEAQLVANSGKNPNPTNLQTDYVLKSRQASNRQRRITTGIAIAGVIALAALAVFGLVQANLATDNARDAQSQAATARAESIRADANASTAVANEKLAEERANIARARELAARSITLQDSNFQNSLLLGVEAFHLFNDVQTRGAVLDNLRINPQLLKTIAGHSNTVGSIAFSPDGKIFASGSLDNTIILWNLATGKPIGEPLTGHSNYVTSVAFNPDGSILASGSSDQTVILWDVAAVLNTSVPKSQHIDKFLTGHSKTVSSVVFSPDSKTLISGSYDGTIVIWDIATGQSLKKFVAGQSDLIRSLAISPDGRTLASASLDIENLSILSPPTVTLWNYATGKSTKQIILTNKDFGGDGYSEFGWSELDSVYNVTFSPDGKILAAATGSGTIILWDIAKRRPTGQLLRGHITFAKLAFSPDSKTLASASYDGTIRLWDVSTAQSIGQPLRGHSGSVDSVAFSPDGKILASGGDDSLIMLWDVSSALNTSVATDQSIRQSIKAGPGLVSSVAFSLDSKLFASGHVFNAVVWDATTNRPFLGTDRFGGVNCVDFSPDSNILALGQGSKIRLWNVATDESIGKPFEGHSESVNSVAFSPDGQILASGSSDHSIILWDVETGQPIGQPLTKHSESVNSVAFSPDGKMLASGSNDNSIILWDVETGQPIGQPLTKHSGSVNSIVISPDGKTLVSASADNTIILWDVVTGQPIGQPLTGHISSVSSVAFSLDGKTLASGSLDNTIILWDVETGQPIGQPLTGHSSSINSVAFSPDSKILASGAIEETIFLWDTDPQSWVEKSCQRAGRNLTRDEWKQYFPNEEYRKTCGQWPIDFGNFRQILEDTIINLDEPDQVQEALNKVRKAMEMDTTSVIKDPASEASKVITEWITSELLKKVNNDDWQETSDLLNQLNASYENLPVNFSLVKQKIAKEIESEVLSEAKAGNWKESLEKLEQISASFENLPIDFSLLKQSIGNLVRNEIPKEVDSGNWQNVLKLLDVVEEKRILIDDANLLNKICWNGSLNGYASNVLEYCEYAVEFVEFESDEANIRDSRGLARALTGDFEGAINDFQYYVDNSNGSNAKKREQWIIELKAGRNPFTEEVLNDLQ